MMKKVFGFVMILVILASLVSTAFAAADIFTPSVTAKPAPEIVTGNTANAGDTDNTVVDSNPVIEVVDTEDVLVETYEVIHVEITPVSEREEAHVSDEVEAVLTENYETLSAPDVKLAEVMPALVEVVEKAAEENAALENLNVNTLVVKDLFHVAVSEELVQVLENEGHSVKLTLDAKIAKDQFVAVMVSVNGKWIPVDFVVNEDGTITLTMDVIGVVAILVDAASIPETVVVPVA